MPKLIKRTPSELAAEVVASSQEEAQEDLTLINREVRVEQVVSTGSTLLDLAISGGRKRGGGLPGGILVEVFGRPGTGKTALLAEICASAQARDGEVEFADAEGRLDKEYTRIYGVHLHERFNYYRPKLVTEIFDHLWKWKPERNDVVNVFGSDSIAALESELAMSDKGDKMGMKRAKDLSAGLRKTCLLIGEDNKLVVFTNQVRMSESGGDNTTGGLGVPYFASLRIKVAAGYPKSKLIEKETVDIGGKKIDEEKVIGVISNCTVVKSTVDDPWREAPIYIVFGYGVDDIRANLQYLKEKTNASTYDAINKSFQSMKFARRYIQENNLEKELQNRVIDVWTKIEKAFKSKQKPKDRS